MWKTSRPLLEARCWLTTESLELEPGCLDRRAPFVDDDDALLLQIFPSLAVLLVDHTQKMDDESARALILLSDDDTTVEIADSWEECPVVISLKTSGSTKASYTLRFESNNVLLKCYGLLIASMSKIKLEEFEPRHTLGKGRFGKVVSAQRQRSSGKSEWLAVKEIVCAEPGDVKLVIRERLIMERIALAPSNFATQLRYATVVGSKVYLAMELMRGGDLFTLLQNHAITFNGARFYAAEVLEALKYLHSLNILYRDLKPENILVTHDGHVRIADFGLSRFVDGKDTATTLCGTAAYFAPEMLCQNKGGYSLSVDYWQFGCFVFELFVGSSPFYDPDDPSEENMKANISRGEFEFPQEKCSQRWKKIVCDLLVPEVTNRCGFRPGDGGWSAVAGQPFFHNVDWSCVRDLSYSPPTRPLAPGQRYTQNFDALFLQEDPAFLAREKHGEALDPAAFAGFEFRPRRRLLARAEQLARAAAQRCREEKEEARRRRSPRPRPAAGVGAGAPAASPRAERGLEPRASDQPEERQFAATVPQPTGRAACRDSARAQSSQRRPHSHSRGSSVSSPRSPKGSDIFQTPEAQGKMNGRSAPLWASPEPMSLELGASADEPSACHVPKPVLGSAASGNMPRTDSHGDPLPSRPRLLNNCSPTNCKGPETPEASPSPPMPSPRRPYTSPPSFRRSANGRSTSPRRQRPAVRSPELPPRPEGPCSGSSPTASPVAAKGAAPAAGLGGCRPPSPGSSRGLLGRPAQRVHAAAAAGGSSSRGAWPGPRRRGPAPASSPRAANGEGAGAGGAGRRGAAGEQRGGGLKKMFRGLMLNGGGGAAGPASKRAGQHALSRQTSRMTVEEDLPEEILII